MNRIGAQLAVIVAALVALAKAILKPSTKISRYREKLRARVFATDRFVDASVRLCVVVRDENGDTTLPQQPDIRLRIVREHLLGGVIDTHAKPPRFDPDQATNPVTWYCSLDQEPIILHPDDLPNWQLVSSAEGAGKSMAIVYWLYCRWLEMIGRKGVEIGVTSPIETKLDELVRAFSEQWPARWFTYRAGTGIATLADGTRIRFISTAGADEKSGARIQTFNWSAHAGDEWQDSIHEANGVTARGRSARGGKYKRLCVGTSKNIPAWREWRDKALAAEVDGKPVWVRREMSGEGSPFVDKSHWDVMRATMSASEARRRVDGLDVAAENAVYPDFSRAQNLILVPEIGWTDVTARELSPFAGPRHTVLVGYDPGLAQHVSLFMKAYVRSFDRYQRGLELPFWVVLDEITSERATTESHVKQCLELARKRWHCNLLGRNGRLAEDGDRLFVRADPTGASESTTDVSTYTVWRQQYVLIKSANYKGDKHYRVPKDEGINMVNTLIRNSLNETRLFIAKNPDGSNAAPKLVASLEQQELDHAGKAETQRKGAKDLSHWSASLRYALWAIEKPRLSNLRNAV